LDPLDPLDPLGSNLAAVNPTMMLLPLCGALTVPLIALLALPAMNAQPWLLRLHSLARLLLLV
jgi:hypothetical protein